MKGAGIETYTRTNSRLGIFYILFPVMALILLAALAYKQVALHDIYTKKAERQTLRRIVTPGARGDIYDRNGKILVENEARFSAVVYFNDIRKEFREEYSRLRKAAKAAHEATGSEERFRFDSAPNEVLARSNVLQRYIDQVNKILRSDYRLENIDFQRHFSENRLLPLPIIEDLSHKQHAILAERLSVDSPVQIVSYTCRRYPNGASAAHVLGYVSNAFEELVEDAPGQDLMTFLQVGKVGKTGFEKAFDAELSGKSGVEIWVVDQGGFLYDSLLSVPAQKGRSMYCSIDEDLQLAAERAMGEKKGAVVALDVKTGEILTMVSEPSYDPNSLVPRMSKAVNDDIVARGAWLNRATQGLYPPGSTFKIVTACAGLMTGVIDPSTEIECTGGLKVGNRMFPCMSRWGHGKVNLEKAVAQSCNVYFYKTGLEAGINAISETAKDFGLDSSPGIELSENAWRGSVIATPAFKKRKREWEGPWNGGDTSNASIGQGYMLQTPLQMACMTASFARKQTRTRASIIHDPMRDVSGSYHGGEKLNLSPEGYNAIVKGMMGAVEYGTCRRAKVDGVNVAAKSGTAEVRVEGRPLALAWMVAFAPADNPQIAIAVMIPGEEPGEVGGGKTAGPVVKAVFEKYFSKD